MSSAPLSIPVTLHLYRDMVARSGHRRLPIQIHRVPGECTGRWLVEYIRVELGLEDLAPITIVRNGRAVMAADLAATDVDAGDEFYCAPRPMLTGALIAIAIASAAASAYLASQQRLPSIEPAGSGDGPERRYGFNRFSNVGIVGGVRPIGYGRRPRYGGNIIAQVPVESSDGSGSTKVKILIELCGEGPIQSIGDQTADFTGLRHDQVTGIYLQNGQPISNFPGCIVSGRMGTFDQDVIPGFADTERLKEVGVGGVLMRNTDGVERTGSGASAEAFSFTTDAINAVVIRMRFAGGLYTVGASGQPDGRRVKWRYRTRLTAGPGTWSAWTVVTLERVDQSEFFSSPRADGLAAGAGAAFDVQVERVSIESANVADVDAMKWDSVVEVVYSENNYPGSALLAVEVTAGEQISGGVPSVSADVKFRKVRVWDGISSPSAPEFVEQYTTNPAWHALDWITNPRFGMGATYGSGTPAGADHNDLARLIEEAIINDQLVERPGGGTRPRYAFNFVFDQAQEDIQILRTICAAFRCTPVTVGGVWSFAADRVRSTPVETFTDADIAADDETGLQLVSYRRELGTRGISRPNQMTCTFENQWADGNTDTIAYPEDGQFWLDPLLEGEVANPQAIKLDGVTDPDQVMGELIFRVNKLRYLTRTLRFPTTKPVVIAQAGERVDIAVNTVGYGMASGRVMAGSTTAAVKIDRTIILEPLKTYEIKVIHPDNSVEPRTISAPPGAYPPGTAIAVSAPFAVAPEEFTTYAVGELGRALKPFTLVGLRVSGTEKLQWELDVIEYIAGIYSLTPGPVNLPNYSSLPNGLTPPGPVRDLRAIERTQNGIHAVQLSWNQSPADAQITSSFRIYRRRLGLSSWILTPQSSISYHTALIEIGENDVAYEFEVIAVSYGGAAMSPDDPRVPHVSIVMGLAGEPPPPPDNPVFTTTGGNTYTLSWDPVDGAAGYQVMTRGSSPVGLGSGGFGPGSRDCLTLARVVEPELTGLELPPGQTQYFFVRSTAPNGRMSYTSTGIYQTGATPAGESIKQNVTFDSATTGDTKTNCSFATVDGETVLVPTSAGTDATWVLPIQDSGALTLTELTILPTLWNYWADPLLSDDPFLMPSIPADQWGVIEDTPDRVLGMLQPPYPDDEITWKFEVRTHDGSVWGNWEELKLCKSIKRTFRQWQARVTMSRKHHPYRPGLMDLSFVLTN